MSEPSKIRIRESAEVISTSDGFPGANCSNTYVIRLALVQQINNVTNW